MALELCSMFSIGTMEQSSLIEEIGSTCWMTGKQSVSSKAPYMTSRTRHKTTCPVCALIVQVPRRFASIPPRTRLQDNLRIADDPPGTLFFASYRPVSES
jgi:hypothetical protein